MLSFFFHYKQQTSTGGGSSYHTVESQHPSQGAIGPFQRQRLNDPTRIVLATCKSSGETKGHLATMSRADRSIKFNHHKVNQ